MLRPQLSSTLCWLRASRDFLGTSSEIDWFLYDMGRFFPEAHQAFIEHLPKAERDDLLNSYFKRLTGLSSVEAYEAAKSWASYENSCATLAAQADAGEGALAIALIEGALFQTCVLFGAKCHFIFGE